MECLEKPGADTFKRWLTSVQAKTASESRIKPKKAVVRCKACNAQITENEFLIPILGETHHFFTNPAGVGFDILTYAQAEGCSISGTPTEDFTWFEGYSWQYSYCRECHTHLGWYYCCEEIDRFFGLITDRLKLD